METRAIVADPGFNVTKFTGKGGDDLCTGENVIPAVVGVVGAFVVVALPIIDIPCGLVAGSELKCYADTLTSRIGLLPVWKRG